MTVEALRATSRPHITWTTIARAERLARDGLGRTPDHVIRRALDVLEERHVEPAPVAPVITRAELVAALAGDDLEPEAAAYLDDLVDAFTPDPIAALP